MLTLLGVCQSNTGKIKTLALEINSRAKFNICYDRIMFVKYFGIYSFCDLLWMTFARAIYARASL